MKQSTYSWLVAAAAAVTVLLILNIGLTFQNTRQLNRDAEWVEHTHIVINKLDNLLSLAKDAETGARGFIISGDPAYLDPYNEAISQTGPAVNELELLTADNPTQQVRFPELRANLQTRFKTLAQAIAARKAGTFEDFRQDSANRGKKEMDDLRELIGQMNLDERSQLAERSRTSERAYEVALVSGLLSGLLALAGLLAGILILRTHLAAQQLSVDVIAEQAERLRTTLASIGDAVITTDLDGRVTNMNAIAQSLTAWKNDDAIGVPLESVFRIVNEASRKPVENPAVKALREGVIVGLANHTVLIAKDGTEFPIDDSAAPIRCKDGEIVGCVLVFRDVTDRRRQTRELEESASRLAQLADAMPQIVWAAKPDGVLDYYNRRWFEYIDLKPDQTDEARWDLYIHPEDLSRAYNRWSEAIRSGESYEIEFRVRGANGDYRWFLTRALPVKDETGKTIRWYGTCTDVDEEKQTADDLRRLAANLSEADRRKNEFLAMLAHELRNPLAPIRNALQILRMTGERDTQIRSASEMMERQVGQLVRLVDDLLDVSRITRGKIELRRERVELASIIYQAVEAARPSCESGGVKLAVSMPSEPIYLNGDSARLNQVVGNLLNNSCKFTDDGGRIDLKVSTENGQAVIEISDTGIGIAESQLGSIFDMFVQADTSLERAVSGLGIGLTLVKNLSEMHGGSVQAFSEGLGHGSVFTVRLPVMAEAKTLQPAENRTDARKASVPRRILVVDDNLDSAESLSMLLKISGHEVRMAHDGRAAVDTAFDFRPEVILLDIGLPRLNGYEAAREIRKQAWGKDMVLIALTGWGQEEDRLRSKEAGFNNHLVKPVDHLDLIKCLDQVGAPANEEVQ